VSNNSVLNSASTLNTDQTTGGTDLCCQAACVGVPCPNAAQANATTECAMSCDQGSGSAADTKAYGDCQSACISSLFFTSTAGAAATGSNSRAAGSSATATAAGSSGKSYSISSIHQYAIILTLITGTARASSSSTASLSGSAASASSTGNAASSIQIGASTAGLLGLVMAALAL
jgi:hypothetical protein